MIPRLLFLLLFACCATAADRPPNVVVIFCDDMGYGDIGPFGEKRWKTPNLDRMAAEGRKFSRFYVSSAVCSASRSALMTGCMHSRVSIHGALGPKAPEGLNPSETTIAELLKSKGYATAIFGKWHLGRPVALLPLQQGFDEYFGLPYSGDMWPKHPETREFPPLPLLEGDKILRTLDDQSDLTTLLTERAVSFIDRNKDRPFFLYVPHPQPHVPLYCSDKFRGKSGAGLYGDVIEELDWSAGQILTALKKNGLDENTLVIFSSDNGPWLSYGEHSGTAGPLREGKGTSWEGGIRVPCLMRWTGKIPPGTECREMAGTFDLFPTIAALTGATLPAAKIDGLDIRKLLTGGPEEVSPHDHLFIRYAGNELQAVVGRKWKLLLPHTYRTLGDQPRAKDGIPVKYRQVKLTKPELYDLTADIGESKNLADAHPDIVEKMLALAEANRPVLGDSLTKTKGTENRPAGRAEPVK
ncbi:MAG TPA: sulfatase [Verrucomicrobiales bacterium]|jgi:arylsulfatase|nr:sulfatase [Verrucomicrobiales bacterium]